LGHMSAQMVAICVASRRSTTLGPRFRGDDGRVALLLDRRMARDAALLSLPRQHKLQLYPCNFNNIAWGKVDSVTRHRLTIDRRRRLALDQLKTP